MTLISVTIRETITLHLSYERCNVWNSSIWLYDSQDEPVYHTPFVEVVRSIAAAQLREFRRAGGEKVVTRI